MSQPHLSGGIFVLSTFPMSFSHTRKGICMFSVVNVFLSLSLCSCYNFCLWEECNCWLELVLPKTKTTKIAHLLRHHVLNLNDTPGSEWLQSSELSSTSTAGRMSSMTVELERSQWQNLTGHLEKWKHSHHNWKKEIYYVDILQIFYNQLSLSVF